MLKRIGYIALFVFVCLIIISCNESEYKSQIKKALGVEHVIWPPSTMFSPFIIVGYNTADDYKTVCYQEWATGLSKDQLKKVFKEGEIVDQSIKKEAVVETNVKISKDEIGDLDAKFANITKVKLELRNGKEYTLKWPTSYVMDSINKGGICKNEICEYYKSNKSTRFYLLVTLYGYDLEYSFQNDKGIDLAMGTSDSIKQILAQKLAFKYGLSIQNLIRGSHVFVAFRAQNKRYYVDKKGHSVVEIADPKVLGENCGVKVLDISIPGVEIKASDLLK